MKRRKKSRGFSLIELMGVMVIMALMAGAVTWAIGGRKHAAQLDDVLERIAFLDRMARVHAEQAREPNALQFDLAEDRVLRQDGRVALTLPQQFDLKEVRVLHTPPGGTRVEIPYSRVGATSTYAVRVSGVKEEEWLVVVGLTGQTQVLKEEKDVEALFARVDAH